MSRPKVVLFDRDGTLVVNVPYNGNPRRVIPMPGAREALDRLRSHGVRIGVVSNQSGVGRGFITMDDVVQVNRHLEDLVGRLDGWFICPHAPRDGCPCRKPSPRLILDAAKAFNCRPAECVMIGDLRSDVDAALAAGARAILVPTRHTPFRDIRHAPHSAASLLEAVESLLALSR